VSLLLCGACSAAVVYTSSYAGVVALTFAQGFCGGSIDAPANVAIVRIHGDVSNRCTIIHYHLLPYTVIAAAAAKFAEQRPKLQLLLQSCCSSCCRQQLIALLCRVT
jgi:hypothetical protein